MSSPNLKYLTISFLAILVTSFHRLPYAIKELPIAVEDSLPNSMIGNFMDDYGIEYTISDSVWIQQPNVKYHILKINSTDEYIIAHNDNANPSEAGLYTRIDYTRFKGMSPYEWGFCLTSYNASSDSIAEASAQADRKNPKKGCNGFPFSRMKRIASPSNQK